MQPIPQAKASTLIVSPAVSIEENQGPSYTLAKTSQAKPKTDTRESATASTSEDQQVLNVDDPKELRGVAEGTRVRCQLRLGSPSRHEGPVKYVLNYDSREPRITVILEGEAAERLSKLGFDSRSVWGALRNRDAKVTGTLRKSPIWNGEGAISMEVPICLSGKMNSF